MSIRPHVHHGLPSPSRDSERSVSFRALRGISSLRAEAVVLDSSLRSAPFRMTCLGQPIGPQDPLEC